MIYKNFDDLKLSRIVFGAASISGEGAGYGFGDISSNDSIDLLSYAYSEGINVFDTAPIYGFGESETRLGLAFEKIRDEVVICSKAGVGWHDNKRVNMSNEPKLIAKMFDESRRRLKSDYIDIYMIHWPDKNVDIRKSLEPLYKLKNQGAIKYIGLCNTHPSDLSLSQDIDFIQSEFNYFNNGITMCLLQIGAVANCSALCSCSLQTVSS
jgi:aryl-alcohol dehydrogenase-like predicted oxidoreductase